jgi:hypothetical protein
MARVLLATLMCTDGDCTEEVEVYGTPEELDALVCEGCGCTLLAIAWCEATPVRP